mgnify:CR=1 FL=1
MSIQTDNFGEDFNPAPRVVSAAPVSPREEAIERALRPKLLQEYVGQAKVREQLEIFIGAARNRDEALDHVLLFGPPGLGKTTLSHIIAQELGVNLRQTSGPVLEKPKDLAALLTNLEKNDVLFIDEIHRLSPVVEEILYPALEDYQIDIMIGEGPAARSIKLDLQPFTLVGATTRAGMLTNPLRDRFGIVARLEFYTPEELAALIRETSKAGARGLAMKDLPHMDATSGQLVDGEEAKIAENLIVPLVLVMLMFMVIMIGASPLLQAVIEEKMQRIAEVLLGSARPFEILMGKLLGMTAVGVLLALV